MAAQALGLQINNLPQRPHWNPLVVKRSASYLHL